MATLNPQILLSQTAMKPPNLDFSQTFVDIAKIKAYQQSQRLEELKYGQLERAQSRDAAFDQLAAGLFTQPQTEPQPGVAPAARGLTGGPPQASAPPPPAPAMTGQGPGPWASGYVFPGAQPGPPMGTPSGGMPPGIEPPMREAPPGALGGAEIPRGLAAPMSPSGAALPVGTATGTRDTGEPPQGLGAAQAGAPKSLLQPLNEAVMMRLYAANPERASKLMEGHLKMQEQKLTTSEKINEQVYQVLSALQASQNPAEMYPRALEALRERGIPVPASFPKTYDPALIAFKMREHETLKDQLEKAKILHETQKTATARADELYKGQQAKREGTQSQLDVATTDLRKAETTRVPLQGQEDVARTTKLQEETTGLINERKAKTVQVTPYTTDPTQNVYLSQAAQELSLPPGTPPTQAVIAKARQYEVEDKQQVVRKTGLDAALKVLPEADAKRVQGLSDKGTAAEGLQNTMDEIERLIGEGVYTNIPEERLKRILADAGLRADDPIAARTARLYELGHALAIEQAGGKLGGQVSDTDLKAIQAAGGNFQSAKSALSMQESIKSMRALAKIHVQDANSGWKKYKETGGLPKFGEARAERLKILTPEMLDDAYEAKKKDGWTKPQLREGFLKQGFREE